MTIRPKFKDLINFIFIFAHDHSTKVRGHSYSLIYHCPSCANVSFAIFMADTAFIIFLLQVVLLLRFVWANSWQYYRYIFRTLYSWWHCSYISYAMSMAIWSHDPNSKVGPKSTIITLKLRGVKFQRAEALRRRHEEDRVNK